MKPDSYFIVRGDKGWKIINTTKSKVYPESYTSVDEARIAVRKEGITE